MTPTPGNPRVSFRAPQYLMRQIEERQGALSAQLGGEDDAPLGSTARRDLERYYQVIADELRRLDLARDELLLVLDAMNGVIVDPAGMYRNVVLVEVYDHIRLNAAAEKWGVDGEAVVAKLRAMSPGAQMALVDLSERFWSRPDEDTDAVLRDLGIGGAVLAE